MSVERSTGELFEAGLQGDQDAWAVLVERLSPAIWGATRAFGLSRAQAEDVSQTVWLRLVDRHETIRDPERLAGWISRTARNEALAVVRRAGRQRPTEDLDLLEADVDGPEVDIERSTTSELVWAGFQQLSDKCRRLLRLLVAVPKVPYKEIADQLSMAIGSIGPTRERCLQELRAKAPVVEAMESM